MGFGRTVAEGRVSRPNGQVENQVGNLCDLLFRPKLRVKSLVELNAWLQDPCIAYARRTMHPEFTDRTIWEVFQDERASLMELCGPFDGFVEKVVRATTTCRIMAEHNRYSVDARAAGSGEETWRLAQWRTVQGLGSASGPGPDPRKAEAVSRRRSPVRQILGAVLDHGLAAVEVACTETLEASIASGDVILTVLARQRQPVAPPSVTTPDALRLKIAPVTNCRRYDSLRKVA